MQDDACRVPTDQQRQQERLSPRDLVVRISLIIATVAGVMGGLFGFLLIAGTVVHPPLGMWVVFTAVGFLSGFGLVVVIGVLISFLFSPEARH